MITEKWCLAFDVGGTSLRAGLYSAEVRALVRETRVATPAALLGEHRASAATTQALFDEMKRVGEETSGTHDVSVIAVAFPGPVDADGNVLAVPTVLGAHDGPPVPLLATCRGLWPGARIVVVNDVTAAGYYYVMRGHRDFCIVTVSSGIGNKVFLGGSPVVGAHAYGGEIGHVCVEDGADAPVCDCGERGHLGAVASGRGVLRRARREAAKDVTGFTGSALGRSASGDPARITPGLIASAFRAGDAWTADVVRAAARPLARVLATLHAGIGVETFIIMGGFGIALGDSFRRELAQSAAADCWKLGQPWDALFVLGEGDQIGIVGAAEYALFRRPTELKEEK